MSNVEASRLMCLKARFGFKIPHEFPRVKHGKLSLLSAVLNIFTDGYGS